MVDAVNTVGTGSTAATATAHQSTASAKTPAVTTAQNYDYYVHRQFIDPSTGVFITEQLDSRGDVSYQNPQGITLAYLRNGLTAAGLPKQTVTA